MVWKKKKKKVPKVHFSLWSFSFKKKKEKKKAIIYLTKTVKCYCTVRHILDEEKNIPWHIPSLKDAISFSPYACSLLCSWCWRQDDPPNSYIPYKPSFLITYLTEVQFWEKRSEHQSWSLCFHRFISFIWLMKLKNANVPKRMLPLSSWLRALCCHKFL